MSNPLEKYTDRELFFYLFRKFEPRVVSPFSETTTTVTTNGHSHSTRRVQDERVEFGHPMDLHTKYAEFDSNGRLVYIGQSSCPNY